MTLIDRSTRDLLDAFSSTAPTPGGGSASALAGAIGASLLMMVAGLPKTRANSDEDRAALAAAGLALAALRGTLADLVDRDSAAYDAVVAAYRRPKGTVEEKAARAGAIQEALRDAIATPLAMMRAAHEALGLAADVARHGNPSASSDIRVALELVAAALRGARLNVEINLDRVTDAAYAAAVRDEIARLASEGERRRTSAEVLLT